MYRSFRTDHRVLFAKSLTDYGAFFPGIDALSIFQEETKNEMLRLERLRKNPLGTFYSVESVFEVIVGSEENSFMTILHDRRSACSIKHCEGRKRRNDKLVSEPLVRLSPNDVKGQVNVQVLLDNYFKSFSTKCETCNSKGSTRTVTRTIEKIPEVLVIGIGVEKTVAINEKIKVKDTSYTIFAAAYFGEFDKHFIALLKLRNQIYEYDGMNEDGKLSVTAEKRLPYMYQQQNKRRKVRMLWYKAVRE